MRVAVCLLVVAVGVGLAGCRRETPFIVTAAHVEANNRAVGLMGQFDYDAAVAAFSALATASPDWPEASLNLGIARMNRQGAGDPAAAEALFRGLLATPAVARRARFNLGLLLLHEGRETEAAPLLQAVAEDVEAPDGHAAYFVGQLRLNGAPADALPWYDRAVGRAPLLRSAHYGRFLALQRLGRSDEAAAALARFEALATNPQAGVAEFKYTRMGPLSLAVTVDLPHVSSAGVASATTAPTGPAFAAPVPLAGTAGLPWRAAASALTSITSVDLDGDGRQDLFIPGALEGREPNAVLLRADPRAPASPSSAASAPSAVYTHASGHPLATIAGVASAFWGDLDDDGLVDGVLAGPSGLSLWRQTAPGRWTDVTRPSGLGRLATGMAVADAALFDADHDGDLDVWVVTAVGPNLLLNNDSGFRFHDIAREAGIAGDGRPSIGLAVADLDADRDADVLVLKASPPHDVFLNDRVWRYHRDGQAGALAAASVSAALAADLDADGQPEIYTAGEGHLQRWTRDSDGAWVPARLHETSAAPATGRLTLAVADVEGDGALDLLAADARGWSVHAVPAPETAAPPSGGPSATGTSTTARVAGASLDLRAWTVLHDGDARGPRVVALGAAGGPQLWAPGPGRQAYVSLSLTGRDPKSDQRRSNVSGLGSRVAVRTGSQWTAFDTTRLQSGPGQSAQPVDVGIGAARRADFVSVTWSDGVFQTELDLAAGTRHVIAETQRQLSSCPVLFAWNGSRTQFVTDLLGVGGIGFFERPGVYSDPLPREQVLLPDGAAVPREGRYELVIGEPMEEVTYLDSASLVAYDLPPGWQMVLDERRAIRSAVPTGRPIFFREERLPSRAQMNDGRDVSAAVRTVDLRAAGPQALDPRFIGRAQPHAVTLEFDEALDRGPGRPVLMADGWLEYPYAQTVFGAWQAGVTYDAPTLEARDASGRWHTVAPEFGYPAGMPRRMALPLPGLPRGTTALRLRTTQEIYWDRVAVVYEEPLPQARVTTLPLEAATLASGGFARRTTGPQRAPFYDYDQRLPLDDTRHQRGWYTAFGDARPLVAAHDDAVAIFGPGEEVRLSFTTPPDAPPAGWTRRLVLDARGWCKDMDMYTRDGETIAPLPGRDTAARRALHARFNTRYASGH